MHKGTLSLCFGLLLTQAIEAGDWLQWRGPNRDGKSAEKGLLQSWPEGGPRLVWQIDKVGGGYSTPAVRGDRLYFVTNIGLEDEYVRALSAKDGSLIWSFRIGKVGVPDQRPSYPGSRSMPTLDGPFVYVVGSDGNLVCLEAATGKLRWNVDFRTDYGGEPPRWAWAESPLIDGDRLICTPGGPETSILAVNKMTGEMIWKNKLAQADHAGYGSPVVATLSGIRQYVVFMEKGVVGVDARTGELLWRYNKTAEGSPANIFTPLIHGDSVYTGSKEGGGGLVRVQLDKDPKVVEMFRGPKMPLHIGGAVLLDGQLYGTTRSALLSVDFETGEINWTARSLGSATVGYADGRLYIVGDNSGEIALVEPSSEGYREISRFTPPGRAGGAVSWTYPVIANGRMYIRSLDRMWCYDVKAGSASQ